MDDEPLAPVLRELGMELLTKFLVPVRRVVLGTDSWSDFLQFGHDGHPWWHFREDEAGRMVLIAPDAPEPICTAAPLSALDAAAPSVGESSRGPGAGGVSVVLPCGRRTTPIQDYDPATHELTIAALDLLLYLLAGYEPRAVPRRAPGPPIVRAARSLSLLARDWGRQSGEGERRADRAIALLGQRGVLERIVVGSRRAYSLPRDALYRYEVSFGYTVQ